MDPRADLSRELGLARLDVSDAEAALAGVAHDDVDRGLLVAAVERLRGEVARLEAELERPTDP